MLYTTINSIRNFIETHFTFPHIHCIAQQWHFYHFHLQTLSFGFSSVAITPHSHHEQFIDPRRIICTTCLQADFHNNNCWGRLPPTSTGCIKDLLLQTYLFAVVLGGAFHGVTRSFHSSNYQLEIINLRCFYFVAGSNLHTILYSNVSLHYSDRRVYV